MPNREMLAKHKSVCSEEHFCNNQLKALYIKAISMCPDKDRQIRETPSLLVRWKGGGRKMPWVSLSAFAEHEGYEGLQGSWKSTGRASKVASPSSCSREGTAGVGEARRTQCLAQQRSGPWHTSHHRRYPHVCLYSPTFLFLNLWPF